MWKEEETSTSTHTLSSFEHVLDVIFMRWAKTLLEALVVELVEISKIGKHVWSILYNFDVFINHNIMVVIFINYFFEFCFE